LDIEIYENDAGLLLLRLLIIAWTMSHIDKLILLILSSSKFRSGLIGFTGFAGLGYWLDIEIYENDAELVGWLGVERYKKIIQDYSRLLLLRL
jgi:hypothetical protein